MAAASPERQVRISYVAGRYLVFDIDDVVYIRRHHGICAVLTGTMPQNPTQNLFLSLPVELQADEAKLLVDKGVGYVADELADHLAQLRASDESARTAYLQHLRQQRRHAQHVFDEERAKVQAKHEDKRRAAAAARAKPALAPASTASAEETPDTDLLFDSPATPEPTPITTTPRIPKESPLPFITPTTSTTLLPPYPAPSSTSNSLDIVAPPSYPLYKYLNSRGYFTTPGLRFGGDFSVYPGDPFRYHAHYLANSYGWDEAIPLLDLVTSGRLGTAVKKSFLFGAESRRELDASGGGGGAAAVERDLNGGGEVRVFCIEWAGM